MGNDTLFQDYRFDYIKCTQDIANSDLCKDFNTDVGNTLPALPLGLETLLTFFGREGASVTYRGGLLLSVQ